MLVGAQLPLSRSERYLRWGAIATCLTPILGAYLYTLNWQVRWICPFKFWTGIPCPTCGMTRSFVALARGDLEHSLTYHALGPVLFGGFLLIATHLALELAVKRRIRAFYSDWLHWPPFWCGLFTILLGHYGLRLYSLYQVGELYQNILNAPLGQFWMNHS